MSVTPTLINGSSNTQSRTLNQLARDVLDDLGRVAIGQEPDPAHMAKARRYINDNYSAMQNDMEFMSQRNIRSVTTANGTASYSLAANTLYIESPYLRVNGTDIALTMLNLEEYQAERNKTSTGQPNRCYVDYSLPIPAIKPLPVPSDAWSLYYTAHEEFDELDEASEAPDIRANWYLALRQKTVIDLAAWARRPELIAYYRPLAEKSYMAAVAAGAEGKLKRGARPVCPVI